MKAVLEIEMPESCGKCGLRIINDAKPIYVGGGKKCWSWCLAGAEYIPMFSEQSQRLTNCPLKPVLDCMDAATSNGKCLGFAEGNGDDEPIDKCKKCSRYENYEGKR